MDKLLLPIDPSQVDWAFVDVDGTLVQEDAHLISCITKEMAELTSGRHSAEAITAMWSKEWYGICDVSNIEDYAECWTMIPQSLGVVVEQLGLSLDVATWGRTVLEYSKRAPLLFDARAFLSSVPVPVCLVSNRDRAPLEEAMANAGMDAQMVVCSEDARAYKPHPGMFELALERTGCPPERVVHIGDSHHADVCGASRLGIRTVWLNREGVEEPTSEGIAADCVVSSLLELVPDRRWQPEEA